MTGVSSPSDSGPEPGAAPAPRPAPGPPARPHRSAMTVRDALGAVLLLAVVVLAVGGLTRGCAFAPTGPTVDPSAGPTVDAGEKLRALGPTTPFPLRVPVTPPGWRSNVVAADRIAATGHRAVRVGYLTPEGRYLRVVQSDADEAALLAVEASGRPVARGAEPVAGWTWVTYADDTPEPIRVTESDGVRLLITGSGNDAEFRTLAAALAQGAVLPR